jgi:hypothetical protein
MAPRAGFWAIGGYEISFKKDGRWYADDEVIENPRIALLFSRHVQRDDEGRWVVDVGVDRQPVTVEDTALVVVEVKGDGERGFEVRTNDDVTSPLDCATLEVGPDDVLYCTVERGERGTIRARFLRPAYYRLAEFIEDEGGRPVLSCRGERHAVARSRSTTKPSEGSAD